MRTVQLARFPAIVVNGAYPDAVGPTLATLNLTPDIGIGNVGNVVPGLIWAAAEQLGVTPADVTVPVVGHHYFSHHVHRFGDVDGIPYQMRVSVGTEPVQVDAVKMFSRLASSLRRQGGRHVPAQFRGPFRPEPRPGRGPAASPAASSSFPLRRGRSRHSRDERKEPRQPRSY